MRAEIRRQACGDERHVVGAARVSGEHERVALPLLHVMTGDALDIACGLVGRAGTREVAARIESNDGDAVVR
jgi:hypothetical protein